MESEMKISGDFIAGFVNGEGCFSLSFRKDKQKYFYWKTVFVILLKKDDPDILKLINNYFGCGNVTFSSRGVSYQISENEKLINIIIPFFEKHKIMGNKKFDFDLWKEAVMIINRNKRRKINSQKGIKGFTNIIWNPADLTRLEEIRKEMQKYKGGGDNRIFKH